MTGMFVTSVVGIGLVVAGVSKLRDLDAHGLVVVGYKILPDRLAFRVGRVLPFLEVALGAAFIARVALQPTSWAIAALFLAYAAGLSVNLLRGRTELDCGCFAFGSHEAPRITWWHTARAVAFAGAAALAPVLPGPDTLTEAMAAVALAVLAVVLAFGVGSVLSTLTLGRSRVDTYLQHARTELHRRQAGSV
jgi:hypothetical protein